MQPRERIKYRFLDFELDPLNRALTRHGRELPVTARHFELLHLLVRHPGRVFSREELIGQVQAYIDASGESRMQPELDTHRARLRLLQGDTAGALELIAASRRLALEHGDGEIRPRFWTAWMRYMPNTCWPPATPGRPWRFLTPAGAQPRRRGNTCDCAPVPAPIWDRTSRPWNA